MADERGSQKLPGNHGQFGRNIATEDYKPLDNQNDDSRPSPSSASVKPEDRKAGS